MIVLHRARELANLLAVDFEVVRIPKVGPDDVCGDAHGRMYFPLGVSGGSAAETISVRSVSALTAGHHGGQRAAQRTEGQRRRYPDAGGLPRRAEVADFPAALPGKV